MRSALPWWSTSCSHESSKTMHSPSFHTRFSSPHRIQQPSGMIMPRWHVSRAFVERDGLFASDRAAADVPAPDEAMRAQMRQQMREMKAEEDR